MPTKGRAPSAKAAPNGLTAAVSGELTASRNGPGRERVESERVGVEHVGEIQRMRILSAMVEVASERGVVSATVSRVVARSGVSRRTFYEIFEDRDDCFLAAFDEAVQWIAAVVAPAYERERGWRERMRASLMALLEFLEVERGVGRLVIIQSLGAGPKALERRRRVLAQIITIVDRGRGTGKTGEGLPPLTAEGVVGGAFALIHSRLLADGDAPLVELLNPLMAMIVLPYLGVAASRRELSEPVGKVPDGERRVAVDPLRDLEMRLTYRTVRVLLAIAAHPKASNRQVADSSGTRDQGQISKLLARLEHLGLICNTGAAHAKGEPNAWTLTARGEDVQQAISVQTARP
jgi:AcrR family transcriptional regulator